MPADSSPDPLDALRRRWQAEPGSRLFLQLAEEYRRADRHAEAVEVLEAGVESHPKHVSAHVALGRTRLEMGEPGGAAASLERALELDATNLVASKLLVEAYLARGERERARQRLDLYRLLNDGDPDVAELRRRVDGRLPTPPATDEGAVEETGEGADAAEDEVLAEGSSWGGEATAESLGSGDAGAPSPAPDVTVEADRIEGFALEEEPMRTRTGEAAVVDGRGGADSGDGAEAFSGASRGSVALAGGSHGPFGDLAGADAERRYLRGLAGEGLFPMEAAIPPPPPPRTAPEDLPEPRPAEVAALARSEPSPSSAAAAAGPAPAPAAPAPPSPPAAAGERPTVTLGQLYLDQGHFAAARRVFAAILDDDPDHEVARRGLERAQRELAAGGPEPVTAAELLRDAEPGQPARRALLGAYLARILRPRESRSPDVSR